MLEVVAEAGKDVFGVCSEGGGDFYVAGVEYVFDYGVWAFSWCSFACYAFVSHFFSYIEWVAACCAVHGGVMAFAWCSEVSAVPVDDFSGLGEVYLAIMY